MWERVAKTATPLRDQKPKLPPRPTREPLAKLRRSEEEAQKKPALPEFRIGEAARGDATEDRMSPALADQLRGAPVRMHHGTHRKMMRGKLAPEARIDLHGMTLSQAHPRLNDFIRGAHARGLRLVLVITGKGRDRDDEGPIPIRRGVLRHQVPAWLAAPPLGAMVLEVRPAHRRHGGDGAYYVYLRRSGQST